jgi:hypothetical protein
MRLPIGRIATTSIAIFCRYTIALTRHNFIYYVSICVFWPQASGLILQSRSWRCLPQDPETRRVPRAPEEASTCQMQYLPGATAQAQSARSRFAPHRRSAGRLGAGIPCTACLPRPILTKVNKPGLAGKVFPLKRRSERLPQSYSKPPSDDSKVQGVRAATAGSFSHRGIPASLFSEQPHRPVRSGDR